MPDVELAGLDAAIVAAVVSLMDLDTFTQLGTPPRLYTVDTVPPQPVEPYGLVRLAPSGYEWDPGLSLGGECGWVDAEVVGVGRLVMSASWVCDMLRSYLRRVVPTTVAVGADTRLKVITSAGVPVGPIEAGTLWNMVETYNTYVEAS